MSSARGVDASVFNQSIAHLVPQIDFAILRASIGAGGDGWYKRNAVAMHAVGKPYGAYHYATYGPGPTRQARTLLLAAGNAAFLAVDDEGVALTHPETVRGIIANLHALDPQRRHIGLYSSDGTWPGDLGQDFDWVAHYGLNGGKPSRPYRFFQSRGAPLDLDEYHGTVAQLEAWAKTRRPPGA
jgi:hypothetical protein